MIRRCPNGETRIPQWGCIPKGRRTRGSETSEYPEEKRTRVIPRVAASESGGGQTGPRAGVVGPQRKNGSAAERHGKAGRRG